MTITLTQISEYERAISQEQPAPTETAVPHGVQSSLDDFDYRSYFNALGDIVLTYESWQDPFSQLIGDWGTRMFVHTINPTFEFNDATREDISFEIHQLRNKILINPLDASPLTSPIIDRRWIWEKWMLTDYLSTGCPLSPYDGKLLVARTHNFALEMLLWAKSFPSDAEAQASPTTSTESGMILGGSTTPLCLDRSIATIEEPHLEFVKLKIMNYVNLAQIAVSKEILHEQNEAMDNDTPIMNQIWQVTREMIHQEAALLRERRAAHEAERTSRIEDMQRTQQGTRAILRAAIEEIAFRLQRANDDVHRLGAISQQKEQKIGQLLDLYNQKTQEVIELQKKNNRPRGVLKWLY